MLGSFWFVLTVTAVGLFLLFLGLRSEAFWKRYIFPRFFGPYWYTALKWESFTPTVFPPGLHFRNVELVDPESRSRAVLAVEELHLVSSWRSSSEEISLPRIMILGTAVNLEVNANGESNLDRALTRLFEGLPPAAVEPGGSTSTGIPRIKLGLVDVRDLSLRYADLRDPESPLIVQYGMDGLLGISGGSSGEEVGSIDDQLTISSLGDLAVHSGTMSWGGKLDTGLKLMDLGGWPEKSRMEFRTSLLGNGESIPAVRLEGAIPLNRLSVRPSATALEGLSLSARQRATGRTLLEVSVARFDPLRGDLEGWIKAQATGRELAAFTESFVQPNDIASFRKGVAASFLGPLVSPQSPATLRVSGTVKGSGLLQYAIVDPSEELPAFMELNLSGTLGSVVPNDLIGRFEAVDVGPLGDVILRDPLDASGEVRVTIDEQADRGTVWGKLAFEPPPGALPGAALEVTLASKSKPTEPITFRLSAVDPLQGPQLPPAEPAATTELLFPSYERSLALVREQLAVTAGRLDAHGVEDSQLQVVFQTSSRRILSTLLTPMFSGFESAHSLAISMGLDRADAQSPVNWKGNFRVDGITIEGLSTETALAGQVAFEQEGDIVTARQLSLDLVKTSRDGASPTTFSLSMKPLVPGGPMPESWLNLATGDGQVELQLDELNREIVEVLLRLQTFGLSERLAAPFYQRVLDLLGFRPDDPLARTKAELTLRAAFGRKLNVSTLLHARDIPSTNFFLMLPTKEIDSERFDAILEQAIVLDRETGNLSPRKLRLALFPSEKTDPFAEMSLQADDSCLLSYGALMNLAQEEVEALAIGPSPSPMAAFRATVRSFFDRVARLRAAITAGRATVLLSVPRLDLAEFRRAAQAAGFPVEGGIFRMLLTCEISSDAAISEVANGGFSLDGLMLRGFPRGLPRAEGNLALERRGDIVSIHDISTSVRFDEKRLPTSLRFSGDVRTDTTDSSWTLALSQVNGAVVDALTDVRTAGVGESIGVLSSLPLSSIADVAGENGNVELSLSGRTVAAEQAVYLTATQQGQSLKVLPSVFEPLSFSTTQSVRIGEDGSVEVSRLDGRLDEQGGSVPLALLGLDRPVLLTSPDSDDQGTTATLTLQLEKALDRDHPLFGGEPLPLFERSLVGGRFRGLLVTEIPPGVLSGERLGRGTISRFSAVVDELGLSGFGPRLEGQLRGVFEADGPVIRLRDTVLRTDIGGDSMGTIKLSASYDATTGRLVSNADLERVRPLILRALPADMAAWAGLPESEMSMKAAWDGVLESGRGDVALSVRGRNLALPPIATDDGAVYTHDPLHLDFDAVTIVDRVTSSILVHDFAMRVASTPAMPVTDPFDSLTTWTTNIATARTLAPVGYRWDDLTLLPTFGEGTGFGGELGPFDVARYKPLVDRFLGVPITQGQLQGSWSLTSAGADATRRTRLTSEITLDNAVWQRRDGAATPLQARLSADGSTRRGIVRLDDLILRIVYPGMGPDEVDDLRASGFIDLETKSDRPYVDASLTSTGIRLDRILGFYEDLQQPVGDVGTTEPETTPDPVTDPLDGLRQVDGQLAVSFNDLRFRQIEFSRLSGKVLLDNGALSIQHANGLLSEGLIEMTGEATVLANAPSPWDLGMTLRNVEVTPFVNSFVDQRYADLVSGRLSSEMTLAGTGFSTGDLRRMEGSGSAKLTDGRVVGRGLQALFGESIIEAESKFLMRGNRMLFSLTTPWNPSRDLQLNGIFREVVAEPNSAPWISLLGEFTRTTTVGPGGRYMQDREGNTHPFRQPLFAVRVEADGPLAPGRYPEFRLRNIDY